MGARVQTAAILMELGAIPPVITSAAVVGEERSAELFEAAYAEHADRYVSVADAVDLFKALHKADCHRANNKALVP